MRFEIGLTVFSSIVILLSYWVGLFWLNSLFIGASALVITYFIMKKISFQLQIPRKVYLVAILVFLMSIYPLLFVTPFYSGSADPLHTINVRLLENQIPLTYEPYSTIVLSYPLGFHLLANVFTDLIPMVPDYLILWLLGAVFSSLVVLFLYVFVFTFSGSVQAGVLASILYVGTKPILQDFYFGQYPLVMGFALLLLFMALHHQRNNLSLLVAPVIFMIHPSVGLILMIFITLHFLIYRNRSYLVKTIGFSMLALPAFVLTYSVLISNVFTGGVQTMQGIIPLLMNTYLPLLLWIGLLPVLLLMFALIKYPTVTQEQKLFLSFFVVSFILFGLFSILDSPTYSKFVEPMMFSILFLGSTKLKDIKFSLFRPAIVLFALVLFFSSGYFNYLWQGDKISSEEAKVALDVKEIIPKNSKILLLSEGGTKMAELMYVVPYYSGRDYFIPHKQKQLSVKDSTTLKQREKEYTQILSGCGSCIEDVEYVLVNENETDVSLDWKIIYRNTNFKVYQNG